MKRHIILIAIITALLSVAVVQAYAAEKTIGVIMTGDIPYYKAIHKAFLAGLSEHGFGPGKVNVVLQTPAPEAMSWTNAARKLIAIDADVIVAYGRLQPLLSSTSRLQSQLCLQEFMTRRGWV